MTYQQNQIELILKMSSIAKNVTLMKYKKLKLIPLLSLFHCNNKCSLNKNFDDLEYLLKTTDPYLTLPDWASCPDHADSLSPDMPIFHGIFQVFNLHSGINS